jgi:hypothetical protein
MPAMRPNQKTLIQKPHVRREALVILIYSKNYSQLIVNDHPSGNAAGGFAAGATGAPVGGEASDGVDGPHDRGEGRARPESN